MAGGAVVISVLCHLDEVGHGLRCRLTVQRHVNRSQVGGDGHLPLPVLGDLRRGRRVIALWVGRRQRLLVAIVTGFVARIRLGCPLIAGWGLHIGGPGLGVRGVQRQEHASGERQADDDRYGDDLLAAACLSSTFAPRESLGISAPGTLALTFAGGQTRFLLEIWLCPERVVPGQSRETLPHRPCRRAAGTITSWSQPPGPRLLQQ